MKNKGGSCQRSCLLFELTAKLNLNLLDTAFLFNNEAHQHLPSSVHKASLHHCEVDRKIVDSKTTVRSFILADKQINHIHRERREIGSKI